MNATLLLDIGYQPVNIISWQKAVCLLFLNKIEIVEEYDNKELRSRTWIMKMPAVVRLLKVFKRQKKKIKFSRSNILARDRFKCGYCNTKLSLSQVTYDHVIPKSRGGTTVWENIISCCQECNTKKSNKTPKEAGMKLRKVPIQPNWVPVFSVTTRSDIPNQWASYLYWYSELGN